MKNSLPKTNNPQGFTLIELLVVVAIIAILSVVGVALFTSTQSKARDSKRVQDVLAMAKAMETKYAAGIGYQTSVDAAWFADNQIPQNPGGGGTQGNYTSNTITTSSFTFCASLENSTGNATSNAGAGLGTSTGGFFCKKNNQ